MLGKTIQQNRQLNSGRLFSKLFHLEGVEHTYDNGITALKSVSFTMDPKEIIFITGPSGAGKSTLLNILAQEIKPTGGYFDFTPPSRDFFIARVRQHLDLMEKRSCYEHLLSSFDPSIYKSEKYFEQELQDLVRFLGFDDRLSIKMHEANGGLRQKVAIVRALLARPNLFIADEPTSSLDTTNAQKLFEVLDIYNRKRSMGIIWASHNRELVRQFSGRIVHLEKGCVIHSGHACFI